MLGFLRRFANNWQRGMRQARVAAYLGANPGLRQAIDEADRVSESSGADLCDYAILHKTVRETKPRFVLECGTGRSTFILAKALLENEEEAPGQGGRLVSMEHNREWYERATACLPDPYRSVTDIVHGPIVEVGCSFVRGTAYESVPDHPYDLVFVDGPWQGLPEGDVMCNMDFIRLLRTASHPMRAFIDNRKHTVLAYAMLLGSEKVTYHVEWNLGVVAPVTRDDILLLDKERMRRSIFPVAIRHVHNLSLMDG